MSGWPENCRMHKMYQVIDILGFWKDSSGAHGMLLDREAINLSIFDKQIILILGRSTSLKI